MQDILPLSPALHRFTPPPPRKKKKKASDDYPIELQFDSSDPSLLFRLGFGIFGLWSFHWSFSLLLNDMFSDVFTRGLFMFSNVFNIKVGLPQPFHLLFICVSDLRFADAASAASAASPGGLSSAAFQTWCCKRARRKAMPRAGGDLGLVYRAQPRKKTWKKTIGFQPQKGQTHGKTQGFYINFMNLGFSWVVSGQKPGFQWSWGTLGRRITWYSQILVY